MDDSKICAFKSADDTDRNGDDFGAMTQMLGKFLLADSQEKLSILRRLRHWRDLEMDVDIVREFLTDKGIQSPSSREELFEAFLYCIWDEDDDTLKELLFKLKI